MAEDQDISDRAWAIAAMMEKLAELASDPINSVFANDYDYLAHVMAEIAQHLNGDQYEGLLRVGAGMVRHG